MRGDWGSRSVVTYSYLSWNGAAPRHDATVHDAAVVTADPPHDNVNQVKPWE